MQDFTVLKTVIRPLGSVVYAETAWVPGEAIKSQVMVGRVTDLGARFRGSPAYDVDTFNWMVRGMSVGEPPAGDKIQPWQLNDLREAAGLPRGPEIPRGGWHNEPF